MRVSRLVAVATGQISMFTQVNKYYDASPESPGIESQVAHAEN